MNKEFSTKNLARCEDINGYNHKLNSWSISDWMVAVLGELGEAANIIKKLNRVRDNIPGNTETKEILESNLREELADVYIYFDLLCQVLNIDLEYEVNKKFNKTSIKINYIKEKEVKNDN